MLIVPEEMQDRSWPEDAIFENGNYFCQCVYCSCMFVGYKRRIACKLCDLKHRGENNDAQV